jgi:hypothetical protein
MSPLLAFTDTIFPAIPYRAILLVILFAVWLRFVLRWGKSESLSRGAVAVLVVSGLVLGWQAWDEFKWRYQQQVYAIAVEPIVGEPVDINCLGFGEQFFYPGGELGHVRYGEDGPEKAAMLVRDLCRDLSAWMASDKIDPPLDQVVAVHVLAHEAFHMAGDTNEASTECRALQVDEELARVLGATPEQARALQVRYWTEVYPRMNPAYQSKECVEDGPMDRSPGDGHWP